MVVFYEIWYTVCINCQVYVYMCQLYACTGNPSSSPLPAGGGQVGLSCCNCCRGITKWGGTVGKCPERSERIQQDREPGGTFKHHRFRIPILTWCCFQTGGSITLVRRRYFFLFWAYAGTKNICMERCQVFQQSGPQRLMQILLLELVQNLKSTTGESRFLKVNIKGCICVQGWRRAWVTLLINFHVCGPCLDAIYIHLLFHNHGMFGINVSLCWELCLRSTHVGFPVKYCEVDHITISGSMSMLVQFRRV